MIVDFYPELNTALKNDAIDESDFAEKIAKLISQMMDKDLNKFIQVLYKMDIDERKVKNVFTSGLDIPRQLAILVVEREKLRREIRQRYSENPDRIS
ncbi:MAG: hypothetical protein ACK40G_08000 [Cytophagaceae bacterium]